MRFRLTENICGQLAYHGSQSDNLILSDRPLYLTTFEMAKDFAQGYNFNYETTDDEKPTVHAVGFTMDNPLIIDNEDDWMDIGDICSLSGGVEELEEKGYDGLYYKDKEWADQPPYWVIFHPTRQARVISSEYVGHKRDEI